MSQDETLRILTRRRKLAAELCRIAPAYAVMMLDKRDPPIRGSSGPVTDFGAGFIWQQSPPPTLSLDLENERDLWSVWAPTLNSVGNKDTTYGRLFKDFLAQTYGLTDFSPLSNGAAPVSAHDVDHLYPRIQAPEFGQRYHRLEAVPRNANRASGANELSFSQCEWLYGHDAKVVKMDIFAVCKLNGIAIPTKPDDQYTQHVRALLKGEGWTDVDLDLSLNGYLTKLGKAVP